MKVRVYAKLNLSLNVGERQGEFHPIDSVVTSVDIFDVVTVTLRKDDSIFVICNNADIPALQNSAYRAAVEFQKEFDTRGCSIKIIKGIPMGSGMGGSSADAAAVVYCLCQLCNVDVNSDRIKALCARIGSDVNFMLHGGLARMTGKGDDVEYCALYKQMYFALTTFTTQMSTKEVYAAFDSLPQNFDALSDNCRLLYGLSSEVLFKPSPEFAVRPALKFHNMLQPAVLSLSDYANGYLQFCEDNHLLCTMTGSGSAFYIACKTKREATVITKLLNSQGFDTRLCKTVSRGIKKIH